MSERTYIAIDLKSFYASVECVERGLNPLTTNLVVADRERTSKTICLAVTPSLKAYGLSGRSRLFEVEQKAAEVKASTGRELEYIVAVPRMGLYVEYSADIFSIYMKYISPEDIHVYSIDEVFLDATDYLKLYKMTAEELARKMILDVLHTTGITATAGIAPNLYLCKVAMDIVAKHIPADENGVRIAQIDEMGYRKLLWDHKPLTDFWRIGPGISKRLSSNGMYTMGDVARASLENEKWLYKLFGIDAEILIDHAWGYEPCTISDIKAYKPSANSISSGQVLQSPYDKQQARIVVREMTDAMVLDLVEKGLVTDSLTLHIGYDRINVDEGNYRGELYRDHYGRMIPKPAHASVKLGSATSLGSRITDAVLETYDRIVAEDMFIRRITIAANRVAQQEYEQLDLFSDTKEQAKEQKLQQAMLSIQKRYGKNAILRGTNLEEGATGMMRNEQIGGHRA